MEPPVTEPGRGRRDRLREIAEVFFKLGATAFGGPAAHVALMEDEAVRRRRWVSHEEFLDLLGATNLIPGPNSTEMAIHLGHRRAGWPGLIVAGAAFILPAYGIVLALAWAYVKYGRLPEAAGILYGVKPVVIAIVAQALWRLGRAAVKSTFLLWVGIVALALAIAGFNELAILFGAGAAVMVGSDFTGMVGSGAMTGVTPMITATVAAPALAPTPFSLGALFLFFLKIGSVLFGSGYVLLAFLRADLVQRWGWLTEGQLLDAIAVGQITPGPVFTTATFIGYVLGRGPGAAVATIGIFLPAFVFVAISGPLVPRLRRSPRAGAFLDGVNVASCALMMAVTWQLAGAAFVDGISVALGIGAAVLLLRCKVNSSWLVAGGAAVGCAVSLFR